MAQDVGLAMAMASIGLMCQTTLKVVGKANASIEVFAQLPA